MEDGNPLIWMRFSTLVSLFCLSRQQTYQNKTGLSNPVDLNASKRKEGRSQCLYNGTIINQCTPISTTLTFATMKNEKFIASQWLKKCYDTDKS